jgi:hypothetical protein
MVVLVERNKVDRPFKLVFESRRLCHVTLRHVQPGIPLVSRTRFSTRFQGNVTLYCNSFSDTLLPTMICVSHSFLCYITLVASQTDHKSSAQAAPDIGALEEANNGIGEQFGHLDGCEMASAFEMCPRNDVEHLLSDFSRHLGYKYNCQQVRIYGDMTGKREGAEA